jgi:hypothetical protein
MPDWVTGVVTKQGTDISATINQEAQAEDCSARGLCSLLIAESWDSQAQAIDALARRPADPSDDARYWPDVSFGPGQQTAKYAVDYGIGDGSASPANIQLVQDTFFNDVNLAIHIAAVQYGRYYRETGGHWGAVAKYNGGPGATWSSIPAGNQRNYRSAWDLAAHYLGGDPPMDEDPDWSPIDVRDRFPYAPGNGEYEERGISSIDRVVYHHGDSAAPTWTEDAELAVLDSYYQLHIAQDGVHGWPSIGYHLAVAPSGRVYWCNGLQLIAYHAGNWPVNVKGVGIVFLGNYTDAAPSQIMLDAAIRARRWVARPTGRPDLDYSGHKDWYGTACPGDWWPDPGRQLLAEPSTTEEEDPAVIQQLQDEVTALQQQLAAANSWSGALGHDVIYRAQQMLEVALTSDPVDGHKVQETHDLLAKYAVKK